MTPTLPESTRRLKAVVVLLRHELVRLHLVFRAIAPYLPGPVVQVLRKARTVVNRSSTWQQIKLGGRAAAPTSAAIVESVFDAAFYTATYGDTLLGRQPLEHYLDVGWRRGHDPSPMFSTRWYLDHFVAEGNDPVEPATHYLTIGWQQGRDPSPWFSTRWYAGANSDVTDEANPLVHYVQRGHVEGRTVSESHTTALLGHGDRRSSSTRHAALSSVRLLTDGGVDLSITPRTVSVDQHDLVSFDIWDTLIMRDRPADAAKVATARRMALAARRPALTWRLYERRVAVEAAMAAEVVHEEYELENVLVRVIHETALPIGDPMPAARELADAELQDEMAWTVAVPETFEMLHRLTERDDGPVVVTLSDFYIGSEGLSRLLRRHGLDTDRVHVICSVDEGASKRLGTLYELVQKRYATEPSRHLHIGDNEHADGAMARAAGADAIIVTPRDRQLPGAGSLTREWFVTGVAELEDELDDIAATTIGQGPGRLAERTAFAAGVRSAVLVVPFVAAAIERAIEVGVGTVHYMSREGALASRVHRDISPIMFGERTPRPVHLEVSRRSTFGPSLPSLDEAALQRMWSQYPDQSPVGLLASLGLDAEPFESQLRRCGLDPHVVVPAIAGDLRIRQFLERLDVAEPIAEALDEQRSALLRYLADRQLEGDQHVVVDVGWRGTIQDNLCHLLPDRELHGVYLGLFPFVNPQPANATKRAVVFDGNRGESFDHVDPPAAVEAPLTPPIPTVVGYREVDGRVDPLLQPEHGRADDLVTSFQEGLRLGAPTAARRYSSWGASSDLLRSGLQEALKRYYRRPAPGVADIWFFSAHDDTFGALNVTPYAKPTPDMSLTYGDTQPRDLPPAALSHWPDGWAQWLPVRALDVLREQRRGYG